MAFIYKITNNINQKSYIGKTLKTVDARWKEHCNERDKERSCLRPIYKAMNKYGVENFSIETLEECSEDICSEREKYWINNFNTYLGNGYNATFGGDGKQYLDYSSICNYYQENNLTIQEVAKYFNCSRDSVSDILKSKGVTIKTGPQVQKERYSKSINQFTLAGEFIQSFQSLKEASLFLINIKNLSANTSPTGLSSHIRQVANGKRVTAYGYKWEWNS